MAKAAELVNATLDILHLFQSELEWEKHTTDIAALHDISVSSLSSSHHQRQLPRRFDDGLVMQIIGSRNLF